MCININVQHETRPNKTSRRTAEAFEHSGWWCVKWHEIIGGGGHHPCVPTINPATPCTDGIGRAPMLLKIDNPKKTVAPACPPYEAKISWFVLGKIPTYGMVHAVWIWSIPKIFVYTYSFHVLVPTSSSYRKVFLTPTRRTDRPNNDDDDYGWLLHPDSIRDSLFKFNCWWRLTWYLPTNNLDAVRRYLTRCWSTGESKRKGSQTKLSATAAAATTIIVIVADWNRAVRRDNLFIYSQKLYESQNFRFTVWVTCWAVNALQWEM